MDKWKTARAANIVPRAILMTRCIAILIIGGGIVFLVIGYYPTTTNNRLIVSRARAYGSWNRTNNYDHLGVIPNYTLPIPDYTLPISVDTLWVRDLHDEVKQLTGRQVTLLVSDRNYLDVLVNWLAQSILYASQPVDSILIVAFDIYTYHVLQHKGFHSVYIQPQAIVNSAKPIPRKHSYLWITRLTVIRLLNYWKYNVLVIDSDAIMMRNIQPLLDRFNTSDIITSGGYFPPKLSNKWNAPTMCMGVILIKSSPATEQLWLIVRTASDSIDDQIRMNGALDAMGVRWRQLNDDKYYQGITRGRTPLRITSLSRSVICRSCDKKAVADIYVWHQRSFHKVGASKKESLDKYHLWLLKDNWNVSSLEHVTVTPKQWLLSITKNPTNTQQS